MTLIPVQITFRGIDQSDAVEAEIRERVAELEQFYGDIMSCRVLIELPHRHHHDGRHFHVRVEVSVPGGGPIVISHEPTLHGGRRDLDASAHHKGDEIENVHRYASTALHEAFDVARRRVQDFAREHRGAVKHHDVPT